MKMNWVGRIESVTEAFVVNVKEKERRNRI